MRIICLDTPVSLCDGSPLVRRIVAYGASVGVWNPVSFRRELGLVLRPVYEKVSCGLSRVPDKGVNAEASRRGLEWLGGLLWSLLGGNKAFTGALLYRRHAGARARVSWGSRRPRRTECFRAGADPHRLCNVWNEPGSPPASLCLLFAYQVPVRVFL